jgi:hypothetical protein
MRGYAKCYRISGVPPLRLHAQDCYWQLHILKNLAVTTLKQEKLDDAEKLLTPRLAGDMDAECVKRRRTADEVWGTEAWRRSGQLGDA